MTRGSVIVSANVETDPAVTPIAAVETQVLAYSDTDPTRTVVAVSSTDDGGTPVTCVVAGSYMDITKNPAVCTLCAQGTYKEDTTTAYACRSCPDGLTTESTGAIGPEKDVCTVTIPDSNAISESVIIISVLCIFFATSFLTIWFIMYRKGLRKKLTRDYDDASDVSHGIATRRTPHTWSQQWAPWAQYAPFARQYPKPVQATPIGPMQAYNYPATRGYVEQDYY